MRATEIATREWNNEVDAVAAGLIRRGTPPFRAMQEAVEIVRERRRRRSMTIAEFRHVLTEETKDRAVAPPRLRGHSVTEICDHGTHNYEYTGAAEDDKHRCRVCVEEERAACASSPEQPDVR